MSERQIEAEYHRRVIGVNAPFGLSELRSGYLRLIRESHPDRFFGDPTAYASATEKTKQLNLSFEFLSEYLEDTGGTYTFVSRKEPAPTSRPPRDYRPRRTYEGQTYAEGFPDTTVTEVFLKSSHIISTGYKSSERVLYIKFNGNRVYRYYDVPDAVFEAFLSAESHGKFAHQNIYHSFRYEQV